MIILKLGLPNAFVSIAVPSGGEGHTKNFNHIMCVFVLYPISEQRSSYRNNCYMISGWEYYGNVKLRHN